MDTPFVGMSLSSLLPHSFFRAEPPFRLFFDLPARAVSRISAGPPCSEIAFLLVTSPCHQFQRPLLFLKAFSPFLRSLRPNLSPRGETEQFPLAKSRSLSFPLSFVFLLLADAPSSWAVSRYRSSLVTRLAPSLSSGAPFRVQQMGRWVPGGLLPHGCLPLNCALRS